MEIHVFGNLGDAHPFDHGGFIIFDVFDSSRGRQWTAAEFWRAPQEGEVYERDERAFVVYGFTIEDDVLTDLAWVDWVKIAEFAGFQARDIQTMGTSPDPMIRARLYEIVGNYYGWDNIDSGPELFTREELEIRWPEFA